MWGQSLAIALVVACGVATFVTARTTLDSLQQTQAAFYTDYRFADVFVTLKRAPTSVARRLARVPGVADVQTRVSSAAKLDVEGFDEPATGFVVSLPDHHRPSLNRVHLRRGRMLEPYRDDEVLLSDGFAETHGLEPGSTLQAIINGRKRTLTVVGVALAPEFVYQVPPGALFPDYERTAVLWMGEQGIATALDMEGAFNDVAIKLAPGASANQVMERVDRVLQRYGTLGAIPRSDQMSHNYLSEDLRQLNQIATIFPAIFLSVAAFLLHVVMSRLISTQRELIAIFKAFGYGNRQIGAHYLAFAGIVTAAGIAVGIGVGLFVGRELGELYMRFYRFPALAYRVEPSVLILASAISFGAAATGTLLAIRSAVALPPAEAMRPEPPQIYHASVLERLGLQKHLSQPVRMIARHLERRPLRAGLTVAGIAAAGAIVMLGFFFSDAVNQMIDAQLRWGQREDVIVVFTEPTAGESVSSLLGMRGVQHAEKTRYLDVELQNEHRTYRTTIQGIQQASTLKRVFDETLRRVEIPPDGLLLTDFTMERLRVRPGDTIVVQSMEGKRTRRRVPVVGDVLQYVGQLGAMDYAALNRLAGDEDAMTAAFVSVQPGELERVVSDLEDAPRVAALILREQSIEDFYETTGENWLFFALIITAFAGIIAFGVIYNSARIALSERSRELASLRILGLTRAEIAFILIGELSVLTLLAIPVSFVLGYALCALAVWSLQAEMFQIPLVMSRATYAYATLVVLVSAVLSGLVLRARLYRLNLVEVLKTRE